MDKSDLRDKVALVTGAGRGIGLRIAERLAAAGAVTCVADINPDYGNQAVALLRDRGSRAEFIQTDLAAIGQPQNAVRKTVALCGRIDILINNARSGTRVGLLDETEATWEETLSVTLRAAFFASQEMMRHISSTRGGSIVNIGSVAGSLATLESASYHVAKAGLAHQTRYLAVHAGKMGVRVNSVCPGFIVQDEHRARFEASENAGYRELAQYCQPLGTVGSSTDVAEAVLFLCSDQARFINGQSIVLDGGATLSEQFNLLRDYTSTHKS